MTALCFELAKTQGGYASTPTYLVTFNDDNGGFPTAALIADVEGNSSPGPKTISCARSSMKGCARTSRPKCAAM
jgi:hypothetical protein